MSDTGFVPSQMRVAEPEQAEETETSSRRGLLLLAGTAVLAVVGIVAWLLVFSGGSEPTAKTSAAPVPAPAAQPAAPATSPSPVATNPNSSSRSKHGFRDPFKALIVPAVADTGTAAAATGTTGSTAGTTGSAKGTSGNVTGSTGSTGVTTSTPPAAAAHKFQVVKVATDSSWVDVKVDGKVYKKLEAGEVFAKSFKVRFISESANQFQFGEELFTVIGSQAITISG